MPVKVTQAKTPRMTKGRQYRNVEFLQTLHGLTGLNQADFAKACGKKASNMNRYLSSQFHPGKKVLASCVQHLFEWAVHPLMEIRPIPALNSIPETAGIFSMTLPVVSYTLVKPQTFVLRSGKR